MQKNCPFVVPDFDLKGRKMTPGMLSNVCVYALCVVESGGESEGAGELTIADTQDAWHWLARFINWSRATAESSPHLDVYVIDVLNIFIRVVSDRMKAGRYICIYMCVCVCVCGGPSSSRWYQTG